MKTEQEIKKHIKEVVSSYKHVLDLECAVVFINAPRALMQLSATTQLSALYWVLGEKRPKFKCDEVEK